MKSFTKILLVMLVLTGLHARADVQDRHLSGFRAISASGSFDIFITQGSTESVKVEAPSDVIDRVLTDVHGDELKIHNKNGTFKWGNVFNHKKIAVYITIRDIRAINISGSGDVSFTDGLHGDKLELGVTGSGDVKGKLDVKTLNTTISGSGDIKLSGRADNAAIRISGSGDFHGANLATISTTVQVSGSGDAAVNAHDRLDAHVSGSGDIHFSGHPSHVTKSKSGSGDISGD